MPQRTIKPPIINNRFTLYSCVVIAPITASNAPIPNIIQEITEFFSGLSFLIQQHSLVFCKFVSYPKPVMVKLDFNNAIITMDYFQLASRLKSLNICYRVIRCNHTDFGFCRCSTTTSGLSLLNYQFIVFYMYSSVEFKLFYLFVKLEYDKFYTSFSKTKSISWVCPVPRCIVGIQPTYLQPSLALLSIIKPYSPI